MYKNMLQEHMNPGNIITDRNQTEDLCKDCIYMKHSEKAKPQGDKIDWCLLGLESRKGLTAN